MDENNNAYAMLTAFLEERKLRKTPERYAILEAVCSFNGHFTLQELSDRMEEQHFRVSRATLYNTMLLFEKIPLVVNHRFAQHAVYESTSLSLNHCHQICKVCGKVTELSAQPLEEAFATLKTKRFHKESFSIEIHGICSACYAKMNRKKKTNHKKEK